MTPTSNETEFLANVASLVDARREGRLDRVVVWTLDDHMQLSLLLYHGVDGIMTNDPARLAVEYRRALSF